MSVYIWWPHTKPTAHVGASASSAFLSCDQKVFTKRAHTNKERSLACNLDPRTFKASDPTYPAAQRRHRFIEFSAAPARSKASDHESFNAMCAAEVSPTATHPSLTRKVWHHHHV